MEYTWQFARDEKVLDTVDSSGDTFLTALYKYDLNVVKIIWTGLL